MLFPPPRASFRIRALLSSSSFSTEIELTLEEKMNVKMNYVKMNSSLRFASKKSNDVDPLETPYMGSTLDLIHGQLHPFHGTE
jgi:hypothetical protein